MPAVQLYPAWAVLCRHVLYMPTGEQGAQRDSSCANIESTVTLSLDDLARLVFFERHLEQHILGDFFNECWQAIITQCCTSAILQLTKMRTKENETLSKSVKCKNK